MKIGRKCLVLFLLGFSGTLFGLTFAATDPNDEYALTSLKSQWQNTPPNWNTGDPCSGWVGVTCTNSRITALTLSTMGIKGALPSEIGAISQLGRLDLSFNTGITGTVPAEIGHLLQLTILILSGCGFSGNIPQELGKLAQLSFLALNNNKFNGGIPSSLGNLSKLRWLDIADNQLTGSLPVSNDATPGLDWLYNAEHFHFNKNNLSCEIPANLFSSNMKLKHILFDSNQFTGAIPSSIGLVTTLKALRLDGNSLNGSVPSNINNLTDLNELHLSGITLSGPLPNLTGMSKLNYVDLSNNSFDASVAPPWFSTLPHLTTLVLENVGLQGPIPQGLFGLPQLGQILLKDNHFDGTLDIGNNVSQQLQLVDFQNNSINSVTLGGPYANTLILLGNPACATAQLENYCTQSGKKFFETMPYSTSMQTCNSSKPCPGDEKMSPQSCQCQVPYNGSMIFIAPQFRDLTNKTRFQMLETGLWQQLHLTNGSVSLQDLQFNSNDYLQLHLLLFPSMEKYFNRSEILTLGFYLANRGFKPPDGFGPYVFIAFPYNFQESGGNSIGTGVIIGIAVGSAFLIIVLLGVGIYALRQKRRAERAIELSKPFASWAPSGKDSGGAPQLKGARWFSYDELKKCTNNFSVNNEIGSGGYGKVYRGMLPNGQMVAIKRAQQGSMQGGLEFKTEIELLSRVHHKNLVSLVGFCFEQGEQMLVYEFIPNGTLRESLSGRTGFHLDWTRRLKIALGSARGLAYLHELATPPIIHRDVKTTNILLDENLQPKVADFGLSKLVSDSGRGHVSTQVKGTLGYLDPEYYMTQQLTEKSDVYSFGVVMLEMVTAKQPIERGKYIVREVRVAMDKSGGELYGLKEIMDPSIGAESRLTGFENFVDLAMRCVEELAADRPTMSEVVKEIETMLQKDGLHSNSTSASSSATDFEKAKGAPPRHPYIEGGLPQKDVNNSDKFDYSGGYTFSAYVEPK